MSRDNWSIKNRQCSRKLTHLHSFKRGGAECDFYDDNPICPSYQSWRDNPLRMDRLDVSQKLTSICVVDDAGRRLWRGQCHSEPEPIERAVRRHAGDDASIGIETGPMTPWLVHELRGRGLNVVCLDARHASAALKMQMNKTDQNDAEGLAQIMRTGWYRSVHVKSLDAHRTRALLGARAQLVSMTTRLSNHVRGVLKTFGMLPGAARRGLPFDRRVEALLAERDDLAAIVRPMLAAWRQLREQIASSIKPCARWQRMTRRAGC
jgi:transposase